MKKNKNKTIKIALWGKHFGEEPPLIGNKEQGAGGIFFTGCNLHCVFCQNYQISQEGFFKKECTSEELAEIILGLEKQGAVNIDLVTPTIWFAQIKSAIVLAKKKGLKIPIVWNSNACEAAALLRQMEGLVDIYLPDFKYGDEEAAIKYSQASNYPEIAEKAIKEMLRQVGYLKEENGIAKKGLIVRHLVLPNNLENSFAVLKILAGIDKKIHLSLLNQYYPAYKAEDFPEINRQLTEEEFARVHDFALALGFENGWVQTEKSAEAFLPDFRKENPFA